MDGEDMSENEEFVVDNENSMNELSTDDLMEGNEKLFAYENQNKDNRFNPESPIKDNVDAEDPSFHTVLGKAIKYFSDTSRLPSQII
jgi:hypothetical protein